MSSRAPGASALAGGPCAEAPEAAGPKHWGMAGTIAWAIAIAMVFVGLQALAMVGYLSAGSEGLSHESFRSLVQAPEANGAVLSLATLLTTAVCVPLLAGIVKLKRGARVADHLAWHRVPAAVLWRWLAVTALFIVASDALTWALGRPIVPEFMRSAYASAEPPWLIWVAVVLCAPLFEELFFRGFLFRGLAASIRPAATIGVTAAVWSAIHVQYDLYGIATVFVMGLLLGIARHRSGSVLVPLAMHVLMNLVASAETAWVVA